MTLAPRYNLSRLFWLILLTLLLVVTSILLPLRVLAQADPPADTHPLVVQEIRYSASEAHSVTLLWGIDNWQALPEELWPTGTILREGLMYTPLERSDDEFRLVLKVPSNATLNYVFRLERPNGGEVWDTGGETEGGYRSYAGQRR